jgi:hypothetical protein
VIAEDDFPDLNLLSIGEPLNESYGAVCAMLSEHMVDTERLNRWLIGLILVAQKEAGVLDIPLEHAMIATVAMSEADIAIAAFDALNAIVTVAKKGKRRGRPKG